MDLGALHRPHGLAQVRGTIYFTAEANKLIGRYDPQSGTVDWLMGTGQDVTHMLAVTKDGSRIFTANIGSDSITSLRRVSGGNWTATVIPVGKGPEGLALSPDERELWTAHSRRSLGGGGNVPFGSNGGNHCESFGKESSFSSYLVDTEKLTVIRVSVSKGPSAHGL